MENSIIADLKDSYGLVCKQITVVTGGWLNKKWKVSTDQCDLLVKQFSNKRYSGERLKLLELALQRQLMIEKQGIPCPTIWDRKGQAIRLIDDDIAYMVMDFCPGRIESPNTITNIQIRSLGIACGLMHKAFSELPVDSMMGYPIRIGHILEELWENFYKNMNECSVYIPDEIRDLLPVQEAILQQLDHDFFEKFPTGITHEDFAADNILFSEDGVSAILDFDRNHYSYIWHDIGRAILSFTLKDDHLGIDKIAAFIDGYSQHLPLTITNMIDALRLTWCMETPWWINPEKYDVKVEKIVRFKEEMIWLTKHWFGLEEMLNITLSKHTLGGNLY